MERKQEPTQKGVSRGMWKRKRKKTIYISAEVDQNSALGKINELKQLADEMNTILVKLENDFHFKEEPTTKAGSSREETNPDTQ